MEANTLDRIQFAFTITYHYLFPQLTMGLAPLIVIFKSLAIWKSDERWNESARFWGKILGITCHASRHLAMEAGELGADYVAFGAFFPTATKETQHKADPEILEWWSEMMELPSVAIGGITPVNCGPLVRAGADFLAVVGAVWNHPEGPAAGVRAMNTAIGEALRGA